MQQARSPNASIPDFSNSIDPNRTFRELPFFHLRHFVQGLGFSYHAEPERRLALRFG
jgi:hypothetical protein